MRTLVALCVVLIPSRADAGNETVQASVEAINEADLGRPYSASFVPLTGKDAQSVFPKAKAARKTLVNEWRSDFIDVDSVQTLQANARAWGIGDAALSSSSDTRFLVYRVRSVDYVLELDDTTEPRVVDPNSASTYYVRKIYFGRMFEIVMSGSRSELTASVASTIKMLPATIRVSAASKQHKLYAVQKAKGMKPTSEALFARSVDEIKAAYQNKDMGPAVPILVEYRRIPGASIDSAETIEWAPPTALQPRTRAVSVAGSNSDWTSTGLTVGSDELVFGIAEGKVVFSGWGTPAAEADSRGSGGLEVRVGTTVSAGGKTWMTKASSGELKLRVRDNKYTDNSGAYSVVVVVLPKQILTANCAKLDEDGSESPCN